MEAAQLIVIWVLNALALFGAKIGWDRAKGYKTHVADLVAAMLLGPLGVAFFGLIVLCGLLTGTMRRGIAND